MNELPVFEADDVVALSGRAYWEALLAAFDAAEQRICASIFIIDARLYEDGELMVRHLLTALRDAYARGVDVRLVVGSSDTRGIYVSNHASAHLANLYGIPTRLYGTAFGRDESHSKFVLIDADTAFVASQNWTERAFLRSAELAVALKSADLVAFLADDFTTIWNGARQLPGRPQEAPHAA